MNPVDLIYALALEDGRLWGQVAADFQRADVEAAFDPAGPRWHYWTRPRGGSKTTDTAAISIAWLVADAKPGARGYCFAVSGDQAQLLVDAASGLIARTPELHGLIDVQAFKLIGKNGATVEVRSADGSTAWGLRPDFLVLDEFAQWPAIRRFRTLWEAVWSSVQKRPGCRLFILTSAGEPSHFARKVLVQARQSEAWHTNEVPGPLGWMDPKQLAELRTLLLDSVYARVVLNEWVSAEDRLVSEEDLEAAMVLDGPLDPVPGERYVVCVDLGLKNDRSVAVVAHSVPVGPESGAARTVVVDRLERWKGSRLRPVRIQAVEEWLEQASRQYHHAPIHLDPWQAAGVQQRLSARGIRAKEFTFSATSVGRLGSALHLALRNRLISLPADEDLRTELGRVRLRETSPGTVRLDHDAGEHDDQAVAIGMACVLLQGDGMGQGHAFLTFFKDQIAKQAAAAPSTHPQLRTLPRYEKPSDRAECGCRPGIRRYFGGVCTVCGGTPPRREDANG